MLISLVFIYTTIVNIVEQPEGIKIALIFIFAIVVSSLFSRVWRSTELRVERVELDDMAREFIRKAAKGTVRIITNRIDRGDAQEYEAKEKEKRSIITFLPASLYFSSRLHLATLQNSLVCSTSEARRLMDSRSCELSLQQCRMLLRRSYFF